MTRPLRPLNFRKLTPQEHSNLTPRDRKWPVPPFNEMLDMLEKSVNFTKDHINILPTLEIWWKHTTEYKTREKFVRLWCNHPEFMYQYAEWRRISEKNKTARFYHFGEAPDGPLITEEPYKDYE